MIPDKPSRPYSTEKRDAKAAETRARLVEAAELDAELANALAARNERRRGLLGMLVDRQGMADGQVKADIVDLLFTLTSFATFNALRRAERDRDAVCALLLPLCDQIFTGDR